MQVEHNVSLSKMTTFHMGGTCRELCFPRKGDDLARLPMEHGQYRILSGGSNLLVNDSRAFDSVICMREYDKTIEYVENNTYRVGASVPIGRFIAEARKHGNGGLEQLISVPGLIGGLVTMNASIGRNGDCISEYLTSVEVFHNGKTLILSKNECNFSYRDSLFRSEELLVLAATFRLPETSEEESRQRQKNRLDRCKDILDRSAPNFGSVFSVCSGRIMSLVRQISLKHGGCSYSGKSRNWMLNKGGTYEDAEWLLRTVERAHSVAGKPCRREVVTWS